MNTTMTLAPGTILQSATRTYTIQAVLGQGGFGITYSATYFEIVDGKKTMMFAAIKEHFISSLSMRDTQTYHIVNSTAVADRVRASLKDFISEAQRLYSLRGTNSNIVDIIDVFTGNNTAYYAMEHLGNNNLRDYIKSHGALSISDTYTLMRPIIEAAAHLHKSRITHLDIKPANIMLASNTHNNSIRPVLIDFGLSKHYDKSGDPTSTAITQGFSDGYAPLEQYGGISKFSPQSDVYALAANILYCLTGQTPPKATDLENDEAINAAIPKSVTTNVRRILVKALQNSRPKRYNTARQLLDALDKEIKVKQPDPIHHPKRSWIKYLVIIPLLVALGAGIGLLIKHFTKESDYISTTTYIYNDDDNTEKDIFIMLDDNNKAILTFYNNNFMFPVAVGNWSGTPGNCNISFDGSHFGNEYSMIFGEPDIQYNVELSGDSDSPKMTTTLENGSPENINLAEYYPSSSVDLNKTKKEYHISKKLIDTKWEFTDDNDNKGTITFISPYECVLTSDYNTTTINYIYLKEGYLVLSLWSYYYGTLDFEDTGTTVYLTSFTEHADTLTLTRIK